MRPPSKQLRLSGWGRFPETDVDVVRPERLRSLHEAVTAGHSVIARGLGRSYGDAALNAGGYTVLMEKLDRMLAFDETRGILECEAGVTLGDILDVFAPRGLLPPVLPGTRFVSVGGAIACDIHGKNHHRDGSFARHVESFRLLTADGVERSCSRSEHAELFWATIGGMGLTGIIIDARIRLRAGQRAGIMVDQVRTSGLEQTLQLFNESDARYHYSVAWIDCAARGRSLGRSVLMRGNDAAPAKPVRQQTPRLRVPAGTPNVLGGALGRLFNAAYYQTHRNHSHIVPFDDYFFPLDAIADWNRLYGARGFVQYQCVVPDQAVTTLTKILEAGAAAGHGSLLAVLKRFGPAEAEQLLSFPAPGYTLAIDYPRTDAILRMLQNFDEWVAAAGGRVYLAKDARLAPELMPVMYPRLEQWRTIRRRADPGGAFASDLGRRLRLI